MSIGRRSRSIPPAIRRALRLRDRGCAFPGCTHDRFLHGHHIHHWLHGGETSVDNLSLLCSHHHRLVHEGGWSVERTAEGDLCFNAPDGHELPAVPPSEASEDALAFLHEWAEDRGIDLGADTNMPLWDGTRPNMTGPWRLWCRRRGCEGARTRLAMMFEPPARRTSPNQRPAIPAAGSNAYWLDVTIDLFPFPRLQEPQSVRRFSLLRSCSPLENGVMWST